MAFRRRPPVIPSLLFLALLGFVVERLVVTDIEALEAWAQDCSDALNAGDAERVTAFLHEDFAYGRYDRAGAVELAVKERGSRKVRAIQVKLRKIEVNGDTARARATVFATQDKLRYRVAFRVEFQRSEDGWLLLNAEMMIGAGI